MAMNLVVLTGNLARDPELKYGQSGMAFCRFTLAVGRMRRDDPADFINCTAFGKTAELIGEYLRKGSQTGVQGRIQVSSYESNGEKRYRTEVVVDRIEFLGSKNNNENASFESNSNSRPANNSNNKPYVEPKQSGVVDEDDDEFPF